MSNIIQEIENTIYENEERFITGENLQHVLKDMVNRDVFLSETEYNTLVEQHMIDEDKIYHVFEDEDE